MAGRQFEGLVCRDDRGGERMRGGTLRVFGVPGWGGQRRGDGCDLRSSPALPTNAPRISRCGARCSGRWENWARSSHRRGCRPVCGRPLRRNGREARICRFFERALLLWRSSVAPLMLRLSGGFAVTVMLAGALSWMFGAPIAVQANDDAHGAPGGAALYVLAGAAGADQYAAGHADCGGCDGG